MTTDTVIDVRDVCLSFPVRGQMGRLDVFHELSFSVRRGEVFAIIGPSGCGKTTLLRILAGLIQPESGDVFIEGRPLTGPTALTSIVFQDVRLLPWRTVKENVELTLELQYHRRLTRDEKLEALRYVAAVGLGRFGDAYPHQLSGGMQQRVGVARALVRKPAVVLLDEPFGALDAQTRILMQDLLLQLKEAFHFTSVLVTHDMDEAAYLASRTIVLSQGPRTIVKSTVPVAVPEPRYAYDARAHAAVIEARSKMWNLLREEASASEGGP